jgi:hypothetical protein
MHKKPQDPPFRPPPQGGRGWPRWTGFANKTLWDWLQLLVVPAMIAIVRAGFTAAQGYLQQQAEEQRAEAQRDAEESRAQDEALQAYLEGMGNLILDEGLPSNEELPSSQGGEEARTLARARTLTILDGVDGARKRSVVQFLHESGLVRKNQPIVSLSGAELRRADLSGAQLGGAELDGADLSDADLTRADLSGIRGVTPEELEDTAYSLSGATMPDFSVHD